MHNPFRWLWNKLHRKKPQADYPKETLSRIPSREIERKKDSIRRIATLNLERQKATLGHGLPMKKKRPAHEMRTWDVRKKPEDDD